MFWPSNANINLLYEILRLKRPHESEVEKQFTFKVVNSFSPNMVTDSFGNQYCFIGKKDPDIMFASHTDTVHHHDGIQNIYLDEEKGHIFSHGETNCLGADDGVGVWLMYEMIRAGVPGLYVFHRGEEQGCLGSRHIVQKEKHIYRNIKGVISFDRKGFDEVITHQAGKECASKKHSTQLAKLFTNSHGKLKYELSNRGVFTDSKEYSSVVSECTNISVGYFHQHSKNEFQDLKFALYLRKALIRTDWNSLKFYRKPKIGDVYGYINPLKIGQPQKKQKQFIAANESFGLDTTDIDKLEVIYISHKEMQDLVRKEPDVVLEILDNFGGLTKGEVDEAREEVKKYRVLTKT